jgi:hypothetical protein
LLPPIKSRKRSEALVETSSNVRRALEHSRHVLGGGVNTVNVNEIKWEKVGMDRLEMTNIEIDNLNSCHLQHFCIYSASLCNTVVKLCLVVEDSIYGCSSRSGGCRGTKLRAMNGKQKVRQGFLANLGTNYMSEGYRHR